MLVFGGRSCREGEDDASFVPEVAVWVAWPYVIAMHSKRYSVPALDVRLSKDADDPHSSHSYQVCSYV
jgi:hypothetical protein